MNNIKKIFQIVFLSVSILCCIAGCEDDPLLSSQPDNEEDGGSYGLLNFPKGEEKNEHLDNPELF